MAELVELNVEGMIHELELMEKLQVFSRDEVKNIKKKRKQFEYKLQRVAKNKDDLLKYIQYEMGLMKLVKQRMAEKGMQAKKNNMEYLVFTHINKLFQTGVRKFPQDVRIWLTFIKFCKQVGYYTHVSKLLDQMLELHGTSKPSLFKFAAQWEWDDNHSIERARKFIHRGLHLHKESQMLYIEGFRLELSFAQHKREEAKEKGILEAKEAEDPILKGQLAEVIYESATKKINDVTFLVSLLNLLDQYPFASGLQNKITEEMETRYPMCEVTWDTLARRQYDQPGTVKERIEKCIATYHRGVVTVMSQKMWGLYLDYVTEINEDLSTLPVFKGNCFKAAFDSAHAADMLVEKHYLSWARKADEAERARILEWGAEKLPDSNKLWSSLLRLHLAKGDEDSALTIFRRIKDNTFIPDPASLWLLMLKYYQITNPSKAEGIWFEGVNHPVVGEVLKGKYVEWLAVLRGIKAARRAYESFAYSPPFSLDLHVSMARLEDAQPKLNLTSARLVHENALRQFGEENTDVWMWYLKFEEKFGEPKNIPVLYERATKTLKPDLVDGFIAEYNLGKADQANRLISMEMEKTTYFQPTNAEQPSPS